MTLMVWAFVFTVAQLCSECWQALAWLWARRPRLWVWHVQMRRKAGEVYMDRWQLLKTRPLSIYINHIRLPDEDPLPHNHPWLASWSLKLRGFYREEVWHWGRGNATGYCYTVTHQPPRWSRIPEAHRVVYVSPGGAWTLFIGWRSERKWGFVRPDGEVIPWKVRAAQRGMPNSSFSGGQNAAKG